MGMIFEPVPLTAPFYGKLWDKLRPEYRFAHEMPTIQPVKESFTPGEEIELYIPPPSAVRVWFVSADQTTVVQIQPDRFTYNWRKIGDREYPLYPNVRKGFASRLDRFEKFLQENELGGLRPSQYELTYVNQVAHSGSPRALIEIGKVLPDFSWRRDSERFLQEPESFEWTTSFAFAQAFTRLHAKVAVREVNKKRVVWLELTARGMPNDNSRASLWTWFDAAHDIVVRSFADLTSDSAKHAWGARYVDDR